VVVVEKIFLSADRISLRFGSYPFLKPCSAPPEKGIIVQGEKSPGFVPRAGPKNAEKEFFLHACI